jgi:hypothetical protein
MCFSSGNFEAAFFVPVSSGRSVANGTKGIGQPLKNNEQKDRE